MKPYVILFIAIGFGIWSKIHRPFEGKGFRIRTNESVRRVTINPPLHTWTVRWPFGRVRIGWHSSAVMRGSTSWRSRCPYSSRSSSSCCFCCWVSAGRMSSPRGNRVGDFSRINPLFVDASVCFHHRQLQLGFTQRWLDVDILIASVGLAMRHTNFDTHDWLWCLRE